MINPVQFRDYIVTPTLKEIQLYSKAAMRLLIGTALTESKLEYLHQVGGGPALGVYQMEPATHDDIWKNYLLFKLPLAQKMNGFNFNYLDSKQMVWNLKYATAMCRAHYLRVKAPLPDHNDISGMADYWKKHYNTEKGKGTPEDFLSKASLILNL